MLKKTSTTHSSKESIKIGNTFSLFKCSDSSNNQFMIHSKKILKKE